MSIVDFTIDAKRFPRLFSSAGVVSSDVIGSLKQGVDRRIPDDLFEIWSTFGFGDFFESEEIFPPSPLVRERSNAEERTEWHESHGLPQNKFYVFNEGAGIGAVELASGCFVELNRSTFEIVGHFDDFSNWYARHIRPIYAPIYRLDRTSQ